MELYVVRHGQSVNNAGGSERDPRLSDLGHTQARLAGEYLPDGRLETDGPPRNIDLAVCSPLRRAIQTAKGIAETHRCPIIVHPTLHEVMGPEPGLADANAIRKAHPDVVLHDSMPEDQWWPHHEEEDAERYVRALAASRWLRGEYGESGKLIAVITHGTFGTYLLNALLDIKPSWQFRAHHLNCGISKVVYEDGGTMPTLYYQNVLEHIPRNMRT